MAITGLPQPVLRKLRAKRRWVVGIGIVALAALMTGIWFAGKNWPFRYRVIHPMLEQVFGSQVKIAHYSRTYFPNPGFIATGITISRRSAAQTPIGTVQQLVVQGHWLDLFLFRDRLQLVEIHGMHVVLPPPSSSAIQQEFPAGSAADFTGPTTPIQTLEIVNSVLEIRRAGDGSYWFPIHELHFENVHRGQTATFAVDMQNAIPSGRIHASGRFGPLNAKNLAATPVSGEFRFTQVRLADIGELHGEAYAFGRFHGTLGAIETTASINTPNFAVSDGQPIAFNGRLNCVVNSLNGDVTYQSMEARSNGTLVTAFGATTGSPKTTHIELQVARGRAEDILRPFLQENPPIAGPVALHATAYLGPSSEGHFLQRLVVDGAFDVPAEKLTEPDEEKKLSSFSQRAQGKSAPDPKPGDPPGDGIPDAISALSGPATIRKGIASTQQLTFRVAGADARLQGTYNFDTSAAHLTGNLRMKSDISHTETGFKSFLLKPLAPFFHHKHAGAVVPIAVTGISGHYKISQNLFH